MFRAFHKLSLLLPAFALSLFSQGGESTQILGIVEDTSGAVIPGVTVTATHVATGQQRKVVSGESGNVTTQVGVSKMPPPDHTAPRV